MASTTKINYIKAFLHNDSQKLFAKINEGPEN